MDRRTFLRTAGLAGVALSTPLLSRSGRVWGAEPYDGSFWIHINATGGWDPRFFFDPILGDDRQNRVYSSIETFGAFSYAPWPLDYAALELNPHPDKDQYLLSNADFLALYGARMTLINGVDTSTINHILGQRLLGSGRSVIGYPSFGTVLAASLAPDRLMAYFSGGGYDTTAGVLPLIRVVNAARLVNVSTPNDMVPGDPSQGQFHAQHSMDLIRQKQAERLVRLRDKTHLARARKAMEDLLGARARDSDLADLRLSSFIDLADTELLDLERYMQRVQLAVAAFISGLAVSANLEIGLFDTHVNNDIDQRVQLAKLWGGIHFLMQEATAAGIGDRLYLIVTSDFGRGPFYNNDSAKAGKDHWSVTSMIAMGPGIPGNRVIGASDEEQRPLRVDPVTLELSDAADAVRITPASIHQALRHKAGIQDSAVARQYPIVGADALPLFG